MFLKNFSELMSDISTKQVHKSWDDRVRKGVGYRDTHLKINLMKHKTYIQISAMDF